MHTHHHSVARANRLLAAKRQHIFLAFLREGVGGEEMRGGKECSQDGEEMAAIHNVLTG